MADRMDTKEVAKQQLESALAMIQFAVGRGIELPDDALRAVLRASAIPVSDAVDEKKALDLIAASQKIATAIRPATIESIRFSTKNEKGSSPAIGLVRTYNVLAIAVFVALIFFQGYWVILSESLARLRDTQK